MILFGLVVNVKEMLHVYFVTTAFSIQIMKDMKFISIILIQGDVAVSLLYLYYTNLLAFTIKLLQHFTYFLTPHNIIIHITILPHYTPT